MEEPVSTALVATAAVPGNEMDAKSVMQPSQTIILMTWLTFFIAAAALYKIAWKPILSALEAREGKIRRSLEQAEQAQKKATETEANCTQILSSASKQANEIVETARKSAQDLAAGIASKARNDAQALITSAEQEIANAKDKAIYALRRESAGLAVDMTERIMRSHITNKEKQALTDQLISEL